jgi:tetratricopeptide (TPR) repeat protein
MVGSISFALLFLALPGMAEESALKIKCVDASGSAVAGAKVNVFHMKSQKKQEKKSDPQGTAEFIKLENGAYRVCAHKDGLAPALLEFVVLPEFKDDITLTMAAGNDKKLYFEDQVEEKAAFDLYSQGVGLLKQSKMAEGQKLIAESLKINPSNPEALFYFSHDLQSQGKFEEAFESFDKAEKYAKIFSAIYPARDQAYQAIIRSAQEAKKMIPVKKGEAALKQKDYNLAIKLFSEAIQNDPKQAEAHANLAIALSYIEKYDEALASIDKAMQIKPGAFDNIKKNIETRKGNAGIGKAQVLLDEGKKLINDGDAAAALLKFEEARPMVPKDRECVVIREIARAQAKLNKPEAAIESFKKSIELAPADKIEEYKNAFAMFYIDQSKFEDALNVLVDPNASGDPEGTLLQLAKKTKDKQPLLAETALERVVKNNPGNIDAGFDLGELYYFDGKQKDALTKDLLTKYVENGKDDAKLERAKNMLIIINRRAKK